MHVSDWDQRLRAQSGVMAIEHVRADELRQMLNLPASGATFLAATVSPASAPIDLSRANRISRSSRWLGTRRQTVRR